VLDGRHLRRKPSHVWTLPAAAILLTAILMAGGLGWWIGGRTHPTLMLGLGILTLLAALVLAVTLTTLLPRGAMSPSPPLLDRALRDPLFIMRAIPISAFSAIIFAAVGGLRAVLSARPSTERSSFEHLG
jgi:hypothetical protein